MAKYHAEIISPLSYGKALKIVQLFCIKHGNFIEKNSSPLRNKDFIKSANNFSRSGGNLENTIGRKFVIKESQNGWSGISYGPEIGFVASASNWPATVTIDVRETGLILIDCHIFGFGSYCSSVGNAVKTSLTISLNESIPKSQESPVLSQESDADTIREFKKLYDDGIITQKEFETKKAKIINK